MRVGRETDERKQTGEPFTREGNIVVQLGRKSSQVTGMVRQRPWVPRGDKAWAGRKRTRK